MPTATAPVLTTTVPHVHLASVGRWLVAKSPTVDAQGRPVWDCTREHLASIVGAVDDPGLRTPIVKLGHLDTKHGIEAPAVGQIVNLSLEDDGTELYGDLVGVPTWLAEIIASAYPCRSVEVEIDHAGSTGHRHAAVLSGLALLGVTPPAIESLDDIARLFGIDPMVTADGDAPRGRVLLAKVPPVTVNASVSLDMVRSALYDALPAGSWAWVREVWSDFLIVDNDDGDLYRVPWTEQSDGTITFGEPTRVTIEYVDTPATDGEPSMVMLERAPIDGPRLGSRSIKASGGRMETKDLIARLGLPEDASDEAITEAIDALKNAPKSDDAPKTDDAPKPDDAPKTDAPALPEGLVAIDNATLDELKVAASHGVTAAKELADQKRDAYLSDAIKAGKFPPSRRDHYVKLWAADEEGTRSLVDSLAPGVVPVNGEVGTASSVEAMGDDALWNRVASMSSVLGSTRED